MEQEVNTNQRCSPLFVSTCPLTRVRVNQQEGVQFIIIIDEWDIICREASDTAEVMDRYINLLCRQFKGSDRSAIFAGIY